MSLSLFSLRVCNCVSLASSLKLDGFIMRKYCDLPKQTVWSRPVTIYPLEGIPQPLHHILLSSVVVVTLILSHAHRLKIHFISFFSMASVWLRNSKSYFSLMKFLYVWLMTLLSAYVTICTILIDRSDRIFMKQPSLKTPLIPLYYHRIIRSWAACCTLHARLHGRIHTIVLRSHAGCIRP